MKALYHLAHGVVIIGAICTYIATRSLVLTNKCDMEQYLQLLKFGLVRGLSSDEIYEYMKEKCAKTVFSIDKAI